MDARIGTRSETKSKRGMYVYPMTITREKKKDPNAMEIGSAEAKGRFESDNRLGEFREDGDKGDKEDLSCQMCCPWAVF